MKAKWMLVLGALAAAGAAVAAWFLGLGALLRRQEKQKASEELAAELKAKVAAVHAVREEEKRATDAAVAKVDEAASVDASRDSVELANDLIADAIKGKG